MWKGNEDQPGILNPIYVIIPKWGETKLFSNIQREFTSVWLSLKHLAPKGCIWEGREMNIEIWLGYKLKEEEREKPVKLCG